jgi:hypothetical protein
MRPRRRRWSSRSRPGQARSVEADRPDTRRRRDGGHRVGAARSRARRDPWREPIWAGPAGPGHDAHHAGADGGVARSDSVSRRDFVSRSDSVSRRHSDAGNDQPGTGHAWNEQLHGRGAERHRCHPDRAGRPRRAGRNFVLYLAGRSPEGTGSGGGCDGRCGLAHRVKASPQASEAQPRRAPPAQARASALTRA